MDPARLRLRARACLPAWRAFVLRPGELVGAGGEAAEKSRVGLRPLQAPTRRFAPTSPASGEVKPNGYCSTSTPCSRMSSCLASVRTTTWRACGRRRRSGGEEQRRLTAASSPHPALRADLPGKRGGDTQWILLDFDSVLAHVFLPGERSYYDLESLWAPASNRGRRAAAVYALFKPAPLPSRRPPRQAGR